MEGKIMKTMKSLYILFAVLSVSAVSCSLKEVPEHFISDPSTFYQNSSQCRSVVNDLYPPLKNVYTFRMLTVTDAHSDIIYEPAPTVTEARLDLSPALPGHAATLWQNYYQIVMRANSAICGIEKYCPLEDAKKGKFIAEAKTMRAFAYYFLTSFFHDVPFYTDDVADVETMNKVAGLGRMSAVATRDFLIKDLNAEIQAGHFDEVRTSELEGNRAGYPTALMLIAKMAMWNAAEDAANADAWYDTALEALDALEAVYGDLNEANYPLKETMFKFHNNAESIFEMQHTYDSGGTTYVGNLSSVCLPYKREVRNEVTGEVIGYLYSDLKMDYVGEDASQWTPARPNVYFSGSLQIDDANQDGRPYDKRAYYNMAWGYSPIYDKENHLTCDTPCDPLLAGFSRFRQSDINTRPFMGPKFWCPDQYTGNDYNNYTIFRYADAVLMKAECWCYKQEQTKFLEYLNKTRIRAGLLPYSFKNWTKALTELQDERARELFGEFQRRFDLVRWGVWYERTKELNDYELLRENIKPCHEYLPIPDTQVIYSGNALDNNEYNKYGL